MDGLNKLSARRKTAVIYKSLNSQTLNGIEGDIDRWVDDEGVIHVFLAPEGSFYLSAEPLSQN